MKNKIQKVIKEIKKGKRHDIYDINFSSYEYLSTYVDGMCFLEFLLKNKVKLNYIAKYSLRNSIQAAYLFAKYGELLFNFDLKEEDLFSFYAGEKYIDFFAKKDKLTPSMVKSVKNNIEIIDILLRENKEYLCYNISPEIIEKLIKQDQNGNYLIEKYFENRVVIKILIKLIDKPKEAIDIIAKYDERKLLKELNENVLMYEPKENESILQVLLNNNIIPNILLNIPENIDFINFLRQKNLYKYLKKTSEKILLMEFEVGKTLLEELIEKENLTEIEECISNEKTIFILYKYNKLNLLSNCSENILLTPVNELFDDKTVSNNTLFIEYMIDKGNNPISKSNLINNENIIKILLNKGHYDYLCGKLDSKSLLMKLDDDTVLIDRLLKNNYNIKFRYDCFREEELAKKLYKNGRYDLLIKAKLWVLLKNVDKQNTYLDYILDSIKSKSIKYNLNDVSFYNCSVNSIAKFYILVAKHGMIEYLKDLEEDDLLKEYEGKTLLDELLDLDVELTLNEILSSSVKSSMKIAVIIKSRGLDLSGIDIPLEQKNFTSQYLSQVQSTLGIGPLLDDGDALLNRLFDLFSKDGKSDPILISALISGYRHSLLINYEKSINELRNLIEIKERNIERFIYVKTENGAFFRPSTGAIHCDNPVIETILHETGHALHYYLTQNSVPDEYDRVIQRVRQNVEVLRKVEKYSKKYKELVDKLFFIAKQKYNLFFKQYFNKDKESKIKEFLNKSQLEKKAEFESLGLPSETLDIILNNMFTSEEYIAHQKKIFINEYVNHMMRSEFGAFMAVGDILDAIYEGELHSGTLKSEFGNKINRTSGHGIPYYYNSKNGFNEMVANFAYIYKSKDSSEMLDLLKSIVGEELYNMLSSFYYDNIVLAQNKEKNAVNVEIKEEAKSL